MLAQLRKGSFGKFLAVFLAVMLLVTAQPVLASWLSWAGAALTGAGIVAAFFPPKGTVVGGVLCVGQVVCVAADVVITLAGRPRRQPAAAAGNQPAALLPAGIEFLNANFQHLPLQGDDTDELVVAANDLIDATNTLLADARNGASDDVIDIDLAVMSMAMSAVADEFEALDFDDLQFTEADFAQLRQEYAQNGLPQFEVQFLVDAGLSQSLIQAFGDYMGQTELELSGPSVSISELLREAAEQLWPYHSVDPVAPDPPCPCVALL
jgi:hypothetical protein